MQNALIQSIYAHLAPTYRVEELGLGAGGGLQVVRLSVEELEVAHLAQPVALLLPAPQHRLALLACTANYKSHNIHLFNVNLTG